MSVEPGGNAYAEGQNGIGIFAQSAGPKTSPVSVTVGGTVIGGSTGNNGDSTFLGGGAGIWIDSKSNSQVMVNDGGVVTNSATGNGTGGNAIAMTGGGSLTVTNSGSITGSTYLNNGSLQNQSSGTYNAGPMLQGSLSNAGTVNLGLPASGIPMTTRVTGDFSQTGSGRLNVVIDSLNDAASQLRIGGTADVGGTIVPNAVSLLPGALPVITAGAIDGSAQVQGSMLFNWEAPLAGNTLAISPHANLTPGGATLTRNEFSLGNYLKSPGQIRTRPSPPASPSCRN